MAYRIDLRKELPDEVRRIAGEQLAKARDELGEAGEDAHHAIHQVRKRGKKLRALLRLVRDAAPELYQRENAALRDAARLVSSLRDAKARVETCDELEAHALEAEREALATTRDRLLERCDELMARADLRERLGQIGETLEAVEHRAGDWSLGGLELSTLVEGAGRTYDRGRRALGEVDGARDVEDLHELRKRAKYCRFHHRLLRDLWPTPMKAVQDELHLLSDVLGDHHDLAVLLGTLGELELPEQVRVPMEVLAVRRSHQCYAEGIDLARCTHAERADDFMHRLGAYARARISEPRPRPGEGEIVARVRL